MNTLDDKLEEVRQRADYDYYDKDYEPKESTHVIRTKRTETPAPWTDLFGKFIDELVS